MNFYIILVFRRRISDYSRYYSNYKWHSTVGVLILLGVVNKMYYITEGRGPLNPRVLWNETLAICCRYLHMVFHIHQIHFTTIT